MCEPITLTAITASVTASIATASASAAAAASAIAAAAASAASAVGTAVASVGAFLGIGGGAAGGAGGALGGTSTVLGTSLGGSSLSIGAGGIAGGGGTLVAPLTPLATGGVLSAGLSVVPAVPTTLLTVPNVIAAVGLVGGAVSATVTGVQQTEGQKKTVKAADKDAALKRIATLQSAQQGAEATAQQQFEAQRAALSAKGVIKASNLGDRSVRALSRAVGFELGQSEATIARNQEIANLETSARLFGIGAERNARVSRVGSGLTVGLNAAAGGIRAGANVLEIRNRLSN